jgi:seryl-tRNA synthetase
MKHYLEAFFTLSGPLPEESKEDLKKFFTQFEEKIQESRKDGEFSIAKWNIKNSQLKLTISSIDSVPPHVAILRIRKQIAEVIGKKYRVGLRGFEFNKYTIETELEQEPLEKFTLPLTSNLTFKEEDGKHFVLIEIDPKIQEDFVEKGTIERIVRRVSDKISKQHYGAKKEHHDVLWYSGEKKLHTNQNPTQLMQKANWCLQAFRF